MIRRIVLCLALVALALPVTASAAPISNNNPYRSFNITGINYGSLQWEHDHHGGAGYHSSRGYMPRRGIFRR
jgi:hypothetical protein